MPVMVSKGCILTSLSRRSQPLREPLLQGENGTIPMVSDVHAALLLLDTYRREFSRIISGSTVPPSSVWLALHPIKGNSIFELKVQINNTEESRNATSDGLIRPLSPPFLLALFSSPFVDTVGWNPGLGQTRKASQKPGALHNSSLFLEQWCGHLADRQAIRGHGQLLSSWPQAQLAETLPHRLWCYYPDSHSGAFLHSGSRYLPLPLCQYPKHFSSYVLSKAPPCSRQLRRCPADTCNGGHLAP